MKDRGHINWLFDNLRNLEVKEIALFRMFYEEEGRACFVFWNFIRDVTTCPGEVLFFAEALLEEKRRSNGGQVQPETGNEDRPIPCPACSRSS